MFGFWEDGVEDNFGLTLRLEPRWTKTSKYFKLNNSANYVVPKPYMKTTYCSKQDFMGHRKLQWTGMFFSFIWFTLILFYSYSAPSLILFFSYSALTLLWFCSYAALTLLLLYSYSALTMLLISSYSAVTLMLLCSH